MLGELGVQVVNRPRRSTVNKDLIRMGITWEEAEVHAAENRSENRMASECGPMHPLGCGLNQGQWSRSKCKDITIQHP